jgi:hypothetical protein
MPDAKGSIRYLKRLPEYEKVKPYLAAVPRQPGNDLDNFPLTNLEFEEHTVEVTDIRPNLHQVNIENHGFEILPRLGVQRVVSSIDDVAEYQRETEKLLEAHFGAEKVISFEFKVCTIYTISTSPWFLTRSPVSEERAIQRRDFRPRRSYAASSTRTR